MAIELAVVAERALISRMCGRYCSEPEDSMPSVDARVIFALSRTGQSFLTGCSMQRTSQWERGIKRYLMAAMTFAGM